MNAGSVLDNESLWVRSQTMLYPKHSGLRFWTLPNQMAEDKITCTQTCWRHNLKNPLYILHGKFGVSTIIFLIHLY